MPRIKKSPSATLIQFLEDAELDHFSDEIVSCIGFWHLQDYLDTLGTEEVMVECLKSDMTKFEIRKLFNRLKAKKQTAQSNEPIKPSACRDNDTSSLSSARDISVASSASTAARSQSRQREGFLFEQTVRWELLQMQSKGFRETVDLRDFSVQLETDYAEELYQQIDSHALLPRETFTPGCNKVLEPGIVLYEMKLQMKEPLIGQVCRTAMRAERVVASSFGAASASALGGCFTLPAWRGTARNVAFCFRAVSISALLCRKR
eukprot:TRINITY_DN57914_c0_g1_i1.p2 TRINITY_DN57914_c0_g1~~TRINITY_DN57914_c0_g1_i1.p2  ORF type:complete len:262 (-),score=25.32 TRINITY_DN57914_c0_g1_i1:838-1623(-)